MAIVRQANVVLILVTFAGGMLVANEPTSQTEIAESPISANERSHWSFQPLTRPSIPTPGDVDWTINPIDCFILARLEKEELIPLPPADRATLIRRLSFDLTGLPPTPKEVDSFVADEATDAYKGLVERLLTSPHFGQRQAQYWLDLARFAETDGFEHDKVRDQSWRYRDWVIDAMNADVPYDRFVQLQLAGDELVPGDKEALVATSFCLSGPDMPDINSMEERKHNLLNEMTATVGSALLGLQIGCAQCHNHKYDPISQADFYRLRAVFASAVNLRKDVSVSVMQESEKRPDPSFLMIRGDWQRRGPAVSPAFPRIANPANEPFPTDGVPHGTSGRRAVLANWITRDDHLLTSRAIVNRLWQHHFGHGMSRTPSDFGVMGDAPSHPELLDWLATELVRRNWSLKEIHRLIVTSATYRQASRATTPGWTVGQQQRAADSWSRSLDEDPKNKWLARFPRQRLEGEVIRDAMLSAAGVLNSRAAGPGVRPPLPSELVATLLSDQWNVSPNPADHDCRSIYIFARRNLRYPIFEAFDRPDANASCAVRNRSTTAPQSLLLLNSEFSLHTARRIAGSVLARVKDGANDTESVAEMCFRQVLSRSPTAEELRESSEFLAQQARQLHDEARRPEQLTLPIPYASSDDPFQAAATVDFCLALLNSSEFVYID